MSYTWQQTGQSPYPPNPEHGGPCVPHDEPADQPKDPKGECPDLPVCNPPTLKDPEKCLPDLHCDCPTKPKDSPTCFDNLIADEAKLISASENAKASKAELESILAKAKAAQLEYTPSKYKELLQRWVQLDKEIAEFIRKLVCAVDCWRCLIECYVCPLLYDVRYKQQRLLGDGKLYTEVNSLADLRYWLERDQQAKLAAFQRVQNVLKAWEQPAQTISKTLDANKSLLDACSKALSTDAMKIVYDVFMQLVPMHLAIAPPAQSGHITNIAKKYTQFCDCDSGEPDDCCGPNVGLLSLRSSLIGPLPYLTNPNNLFAIICCLTQRRYTPAKKAYVDAKTAWEAKDAEFSRLKSEIEEAMKSLGANAKASFPADCSHWKKPCPPVQAAE